MIPKTITFYRKPIHPVPQSSPLLDSTAPKSSPARSPLIARQDIFEEVKPATPTYDPSIYGSVSIDAIVADIKARLVHDVEASRIAIEPRHVKLLGLEPDADRLKALGRWEVEISLATTSDKAAREPVRKTVEILPEEGEAPSEHTNRE